MAIAGEPFTFPRTACDDVHLNPVRAKLLEPGERLLAYPWSSFPWYLAAPEHRPSWLRVDRLLGERGLQQDTAAGREEFERRIECRRFAAAEEAQWKPPRRGWLLGGGPFRTKLLALMEAVLGDHHPGRLGHQSAEAKAERISAEELQRLKWEDGELQARPKGDSDKLGTAARLRRETTLTIQGIAQRLRMGSWKSLNNKLYLARKAQGVPGRQ